MTDIPEDIQREAERVWKLADEQMTRGEAEHVIAAAILAERERAAKYVENVAHEGVHGSMWERNFQRAADAIRKGEP